MMDVALWPGHKIPCATVQGLRFPSVVNPDDISIRCRDVEAWASPCRRATEGLWWGLICYNLASPSLTYAYPLNIRMSKFSPERKEIILVKSGNMTTFNDLFLGRKKNIKKSQLTTQNILMFIPKSWMNPRFLFEQLGIVVTFIKIVEIP